jgi:membrane protein DedA with SNARE-associated domain
MTKTIIDLIGPHGLLAVFSLMAVDALLPVGGELIMLLAGVLAAGALGNNSAGVGTGAFAYVVLAAAGTVGYLTGAVVGWFIGQRGGTRLIARHGRWLHLSPQRMKRAQAWFDRHGRAAVLLGRLTPIVRSFISVPAGVFGSPLPSYVALTALGSAIWCFAFAGAGWALGSNWESLHGAFRYVDVIAIAGLLGIAAWLLLRGRSSAA